ncbi:maleylpyruvate isomerase N-terminal domain-containing protein [Streptomyces sp. NPDC005648]|uniref:maleylpyruvate isomerase N-terminal domain-containing protein n=1 Tax=Streptomyces sp. NPDC005648 TaxID=3157044 RepID=UPI0033A825FB
MEETLEFPARLRLIEERSAAFRAAVASAPDLDARVPTCPDWALRDLVRHLGDVHRRWAANVTAGPADGPTGTPVPDSPRDRAALLAWSAESTDQLLGALREFGPDRDCWTWWGKSESPQTSGAVARHQVQEATVHTYDAQLTAGAAQPLPVEAALDGVEEFLSTCVAWTGTWPHEPATVDYHATEGRSWRLFLSPDGARFTRLATPAPAPATASARGTASELVLFLYDRIPLDSLQPEGDPSLFSRLRDWDPEEA